MDVRTLSFDDATFDVAIDKGKGALIVHLQDLKGRWTGTMDAMMTTKGDLWNPPAEVVENCNKEVDETLRQVVNIINLLEWRA